jgi:predicted Zn-dependent protease
VAIRKECLLVGLSLLLSGCITFSPAVPDLTGQLYRSTPTVRQALLKAYPPFQNKRLTDYVQGIGQQVTKKLLNRTNFYFIIVTGTEAHLFSSPDGEIFITVPAILAMADEDELVSVLAHEIAHVASDPRNKRVEELAESMRAWGLKTAYGVIAGAATKSPVETAVGVGIDLTIFLVGELMSLSAGERATEKLVDKLGMEATRELGYDPSGLKTYKEELQGRVVKDVWLAGHPWTPEREEALSAHLAAQGQRSYSRKREELLREKRAAFPRQRYK